MKIKVRIACAYDRRDGKIHAASCVGDDDATNAIINDPYVATYHPILYMSATKEQMKSFVNTYKVYCSNLAEKILNEEEFSLDSCDFGGLPPSLGNCGFAWLVKEIEIADNLMQRD